VPLQVIEAEFSSSDEQRMQGVPKGGVAAEESGFRTPTADRHAQKLGLAKVYYQIKQPLSWQGVLIQSYALWRRLALTLS